MQLQDEKWVAHAPRVLCPAPPPGSGSAAPSDSPSGAPPRDRDFRRGRRKQHAGRVRYPIANCIVPAERSAARAVVGKGGWGRVGGAQSKDLRGGGARDKRWQVRGRALLLPAGLPDGKSERSFD